MDYSEFYLHARKELKDALDSLNAQDFQKAYEHCLNAQTELRLMTGAVKAWLPSEENT